MLLATCAMHVAPSVVSVLQGSTSANGYSQKCRAGQTCRCNPTTQTRCERHVQDELVQESVALGPSGKWRTAPVSACGQWAHRPTPLTPLQCTFRSPHALLHLCLQAGCFEVEVKKKNMFQLLGDLPFCNTLFEENKCIFVLSSSCPSAQSLLKNMQCLVRLCRTFSRPTFGKLHVMAVQ